MAKLRIRREDCTPLGSLLVDHMVDQRINLQELAKLCGISPSGLRKSMLPGGNPGSITLDKISRGSGIPAEELYQAWMQSKSLASVPAVVPDDSSVSEIALLPPLPRPKANRPENQRERAVEMGLAGIFHKPLNAEESRILLADQVNRGQMFLDLGQIDNAYAEFNQVLQLAEAAKDLYHQCKAHRFLGRCIFENNLNHESLTKSFQCYERALELSEQLKFSNLAQAREQKAAVLANLGNWHLQRGDFQKALDAYDRSIISAREDFPIYRWRALFGKGLIAQTKCNWEAAVEAFQLAELTCEEDRIKSVMLWSNLGYSLTNYEAYDQAEQVLLKITRFAMHKEEKHYRAFALFKLGFNEECRARAREEPNLLLRAQRYYQLSSQVLESPDATLGMARITAKTDLQQGRLMAAVGLKQLIKQPFNSAWDYTSEFKTVLDLLGEVAVIPTLNWIAQINQSFPASVEYWQPSERRSLLNAVENLAKNLQGKSPYLHPD